MFTNFQTVGQIKSEYRRLAKLNHPDLGGNTQTMQEINRLYHNALEMVSGQVHTGSDGKNHTYTYNEQREKAVMDKVLEILGLGLDNLKVEIIGIWVWVSGSTKDQKDLLNRKGVGLKWHGKRGMWYWKPYRSKTRYSNRSTGQLREMYGSRRFETQGETALAA